jgi:O-antigen ligase
VVQRVVDTLSFLTLPDIATIPVTDANFAAVERLAHWQAAREMWRDNPWLGVGFGNYAVIYPAYAIGRWTDPLGHAHNYLLNLGAETGLVGIVGYLIFWISAFGLLWVVVQRRSGLPAVIAAGCLGIIVHLHIHNFVDNLYVQGMYLHVAIILGAASVIYNRHHQPAIEPTISEP